MNGIKIVGLETEYAALVKGSDRVDLSCLFQDLDLQYHARWDDQPERPWCDARGFVPAAAVPSGVEPPLELLALPSSLELRTSLSDPELGTPSSNSEHAPLQAITEPAVEAPVNIIQEKSPSVMLPNGARFYLDHTHPEWSTPECASPLEVVAYDKAGDAWLNERVTHINATRRPEERLAIYKNNVDFYGNGYGCHENYMLDAVPYTSLFGRSAHRLYTVLIPFLVTRQILCGAGRVAPVGSGGDMGFHISQRADLFESILGLQTTFDRPIINTRDEPHADPTRFRRLHVIVGDSNMSEYSTYLKIGATALVLEMLSNNFLRLDITLSDPLHAIHVISQDPTCHRSVELESGNRHYTAIDVQRCFIEATARYLEEYGDHSYGQDVLTVWSDTVESLAQNPVKLANRIDWVIKYMFLQRQMNKRGWTWATPQVRELDIKYHQIDPEQSLFYLLQSKGLVTRLLTDDEIRWSQDYPPQATRASLRTMCLNRYPEQVLAINWDTIVFVDQERRILRWRWGDPADRGGEDAEVYLREAEYLEIFARQVLAAQTIGEREK